jgi:hypothetical protein
MFIVVLLRRCTNLYFLHLRLSDRAAADAERHAFSPQSAATAPAAAAAPANKILAQPGTITRMPCNTT